MSKMSGSFYCVCCGKTLGQAAKEKGKFACKRCRAKGEDVVNAAIEARKKDEERGEKILKALKDSTPSNFGSKAKEGVKALKKLAEMFSDYTNVYDKYKNDAFEKELSNPKMWEKNKKQNYSEPYVLLPRVTCPYCGKRFRPHGKSPYCPTCDLEMAKIEMAKPKTKINTCCVCQKKVKCHHHDLGFICSECLAKKKCPICSSNLIEEDKDLCDECLTKILKKQKPKPNGSKPKPKVGQRKVKFADEPVQ